MTNLLSPADYIQTPRVSAYARHYYGDEQDQYGDLFLPTTKAPDGGHPVIVLLHGGCWQNQFDGQPLSGIARDLADAGFAVWNLEYARIGGRGGWPGTFVDAALGIDYLRELAGSEPLDLKRVTAAGHSAGGHLVLWLSARHKLEPSSQLYFANPLLPSKVISLAGIGDLEDATERNICRGAPKDLVAGSYAEVPERYEQGSPHRLLPLETEHTHIVGAGDILVPEAHVRHFVALAETAGDTVTCISIPNAGHFEIVLTTSAAWAQVKAIIVDSAA